MDTIQVNVSSGQQGEYYDLVRVKQLIDEIQEEIGGHSASQIIEESGNVTELDAAADNIYVWTSAPQFLVLNLITAENTSVTHNYTFIFEAGNNFTLSVIPDDDIPVIVERDASVVTGGYNKVCANYTDGAYYITISNYKV